MKRRWLIACGLFALSVPIAGALAQGGEASARITGVVTTADGGQPLANVQVVVVGTQAGSVTRDDGRYTISVQPGTYRLRVNRIGFAPDSATNVVVAAGGTATVNFQLTQQAVVLQQTVVVGYGTQAKRDVTGSVATVNAEQIAQTPKINVTETLKGRVPGVDIVTTGYKPGDGTKVRIRGTRSLKAGNDPLYVLDGIPMAGGLNDIQATDIETIEVLKDASATAVFGSRGANGVVLITTKKGSGALGRPRVTYDVYTGQANALRRVDMLSGPEFVELRREAKKTVGKYRCDAGVAQCDSGDKEMLYPIEYEMYKAGRWTDWQDVILRNGYQGSHQLAVQGGNDRTQYALSGSLTQQDGVILGQDFDRKSMRVNVETQANSRFRFGGSALVMRSTQNIGRGDDVYSEALQNSPLGPAFDSTGARTFRPTPDGQRVNPLADIENFIDRRERTRAFGTLFANLNLFEGVDWRMNFGPDLAYVTRGRFRGSETQANFGSGADALVEEDRNFNYTLDNILSVRRALGSAHRFDGTFLYSQQRNWEELHDTEVDGLPYEHQLFYNLGSADLVNRVASGKSEWALESFMGRLNYALLDRYLFTVTSRWDGSSRLAPGNKWAMFPSVAFGWQIADEPFMRGQSLFSSMKLRTSWGRAGNTAVAPYQTQGLLSRTTYAWDNTGAFGYRPGALENPFLEWEKTEQMDVGLDWGVMRDRVSGTIDVYRANTSDLLMDRQLPSSTGFTSVVQNIGETRNTGLELGINTVVLENWKGLRWNVDANWSANKNEIVSLYGGTADDPGNTWFIGQPINEGTDGDDNRVWYTQKFGGIWQQQDSALAASYGMRVGQIRPVDLNNDGKIDQTDRAILGNTYPKWTASLSTRFDFKGIDFSAMAITRQGFMIQNSLYTTNDRLDARYNNVRTNYWTPTNPSNTDPRPNYDQEGPVQGGLRGFEDGSFVKIRNITLGYTFGGRLANRVGANRLRVYGTAQDPFLFTESRAIDPEGRASAGSPSYRTMLLGASVEF